MGECGDARFGKYDPGCPVSLAFQCNGVPDVAWDTLGHSLGEGALTQNCVTAKRKHGDCTRLILLLVSRSFVLFFVVFS